MKRILLITTVFLLRAGVQHAQSIPFPANKAVWKEEHITFIGPVFHHFGICGDTLIDGATYGQVFDFQTDSTGAISGGAYMGGIRSGGNIVRFFPANSAAEYTLFDFSLQAGQTVQLQSLFGDQITRTVDSVKTEALAGQPRKVIYFKPSSPGFPLEFWMEGIGSSYGLLGRGVEQGGDLGYTLLCFQHENTYLNLTLIECFLPALPDCELTNGSEEKPAFGKVSISPNPASDLVQVRFERNGVPPKGLKMFDTGGRLLLSEQVDEEGTANLDVSHLPNGFYWLKAENPDSRGVFWCGKIVVQHQ